MSEASDAKSLSMTPDEAYVLHRWHREMERKSAAKGDYRAAIAFSERAAEIEMTFWPAAEWERAWSKPA